MRINLETSSRIADIALLLTYGAVIGFFLWRAIDTRRLLARRLASLAVSLLPLGWIFIALWSLGLWKPQPSGWARWVGVAIALFLLSRVWEVSKKGPEQ